MEIKRKDLQFALEMVKPGLAKDDKIEQATSFAFIKNRVVTYNDEISVSHPIKGLKLTGAVEAEKLYAFLAKVTNDDIELNVTEKELRLVAGRAKAGFTLQSEIKLPLSGELEETGDWVELPENFAKFVSFAIPSCSREQSKPRLKCVHITSDGIVEASDGYRITRCDLGVELPIKSFLLQASSAIHVVRISPTKIAEGNGWIHFGTGEGTVLSCRLLEDEFPDTAAHMTVKGVKILFPNSINDVLSKAMIFSKREKAIKETVYIEIDANKMTVSAKADTGWFEETLNFKYSGEGINFAINPTLLEDIMKETQEGTLGKGKILFQGEGWQYMSLLKDAK